MSRFNIRSYGIYVRDGYLLVTDEIRFGIKMTKLPGGGLKFGEGLAEGLKREWREELDVNIEVGEVFFVNPFLQISAFRETDEVICMYFWVDVLDELNVTFTERPLDFPTDDDGQQVFRWVPVASLDASTFTFPIDQALIPRLRKALL